MSSAKELSFSLIQCAHEIGTAITRLNISCVLSFISDLKSSFLEGLHTVSSRHPLTSVFRLYLTQHLHKLLLVKQLKHPLSKPIKELRLCPQIYGLGISSQRIHHALA